MLFCYVRTEYRLKVQGEQTLQAGATVTLGAKDPFIRYTGIQEAIMDSSCLLVEKFEDIKEVDKMTLPHHYTIH